MANKPENPSAFPISTIDGFTQHGMTLRDWFAGQAINGLLSVETTLRERDEARARRAYEIADTLLAARTTPLSGES